MHFWNTFFALSAISILCHHYRKDLYSVAKPLPMLMLLSPIAVDFHSISPTQYGILLGLFFGLIGDICLLKGENKKFFLVGLVFFLFNHLGYISTFLYNVSQWSIPNEAFVVMLLAIGAWGFIMVRLLLKSKHSEFLVPVMVYFCVISVMLMTALNIDLAVRPDIPFLTLGALMFVISDSMICLNKFIMPFPLADFLILATYYPAQALIARGTFLATFQ